MVEKMFYFAEDIMKILNCKKTKAYQIIRKLNRELEAKGYLVDTGRVNIKYFKERFGIS